MLGYPTDTSDYRYDLGLWPDIEPRDRNSRTRITFRWPINVFIETDFELTIPIRDTMALRHLDDIARIHSRTRKLLTSLDPHNTDSRRMMNLDKYLRELENDHRSIWSTLHDRFEALGTDSVPLFILNWYTVRERWTSIDIELTPYNFPDSQDPPYDGY